MKKVVVAAVFFASLFAMANGLEDLIVDQPQQRSPVLLRAEHSNCLNGIEMSCTAGTDFYMADDGRCGCLAKPDVIDSYTCDRGLIACNADAGETFSQVYQYHNMCGMIQKMRVGCGCYATDSGMSATRVGAGVR